MKIAVFFAIGLLCVPAQAEPFYFKRGNSGAMLITNRPDQHTQLKAFSLALSPYTGTVSWRYANAFEPKHLFSEYQSIIKSASLAHGIRPSLIRAVIHAESGFNPGARSPRGARGLMQLMPATAQELGVHNIHSPDDNVQGGTRYLAQMLSRYQGNLRKALAAYNAGPGAVDQFNGIPPYRETIKYVDRVLELERRYRKL